MQSPDRDLRAGPGEGGSQEGPGRPHGPKTAQRARDDVGMHGCARPRRHARTAWCGERRAGCAATWGPWGRVPSAQPAPVKSPWHRPQPCLAPPPGSPQGWDVVHGAILSVPLARQDSCPQVPVWRLHSFIPPTASGGTEKRLAHAKGVGRTSQLSPPGQTATVCPAPNRSHAARKNTVVTTKWTKKSHLRRCRRRLSWKCWAPLPGTWQPGPTQVWRTATTVQVLISMHC